MSGFISSNDIRCIRIRYRAYGSYLWFFFPTMHLPRQTLEVIHDGWAGRTLEGLSFSTFACLGLLAIQDSLGWRDLSRFAGFGGPQCVKSTETSMDNWAKIVWRLRKCLPDSG
ncbi:hypothetical protein BJX61DRAFT_505490 [Aspergillus egyptiacus]|nr:hypothetical protein BJX61DRAFT_505490 [Aspergillus egyptiacus]